MNSVMNPSVPFSVSIPGGMLPGKMIKIQGFVPYASDRFGINLLCGQTGSIALHVSPNFHQNSVERHAVQNLQITHREKSGPVPIQQGCNFEVLILCDPENFKIAFNGQHFTEFPHQLSYNSITNLAVDGQVIVHSVNYEQNLGRNIGVVVPPTPSYGSNYGPPGSQSVPPYPSSAPIGGSPYQSNSGPPYTNYNPGYPTQGGYGYNAPYPQNPGGQHGSYPTNGGYQTQTQAGYPHSPKAHKSTGLLDKAGMAVAGVLGTSALLGGKNKLDALGQKLGAVVASATALTDQLNPKKAMKKQLKAQKKALKYGLPIAGAGLGAYALHKGLHKGFHGFRRSSSSSSSSSD